LRGQVQATDDELDEWSLVEPQPAGLAVAAGMTPLSYICLQLEAPRLVEDHFSSAVDASAAGGSDQQVEELTSAT